jgi:hypothetical protein
MGRGLWQLCAKFGKLPHEFMACGDPEYAFIVTGWNDNTERDNEAHKKAGK